jgi:hypothetical protein
MLRARYAVSVAVITSAAVGRRRSSRPVGYAVGNVGFLFALGKVGRDAFGISPTGILDPLWGGENRGRAENEASNRHSCVPQFHGTPHRGLLSWRFIAHLSDHHPPINLQRAKPKKSMAQCLGSMRWQRPLPLPRRGSRAFWYQRLRVPLGVGRL